MSTAYPAPVNLSVTHTFKAAPEALAEALLDPDFQESLADIASLRDRRLLAQENQQDGKVVRNIRCVLDLHVSGMAKTVLGDADPAWVEESVWDPKTMTWSWKIKPEVAADLLSASGTTVVQSSGAGSARIVTGTIKVKVPLYGGKVEGWIADGVEAAYEEEAERLRSWLGESA